MLLAGVNDRDVDAENLADVARSVPSKVNLIPYNSVPGMPYRCPDATTIDRFSELLYTRHVSVVVRRRKGADVHAACGQLRRATE